MTPDTLIDRLSGSVETTATGTVIYRNAAGKSHRIGGPAIIHPSGEEHWHQNGKLHRTDGPAVVHPNGLRVWSLNGVPMLEDEHSRRIASGEYLEP